MFGLVRPLIFKLDAERAHWATVQALAHAPALASLPWRHPVVSDPVELFGVTFRNRVGLAAGMDKNGEAIAAFARLGFGFVEVGTVTPRPQPGNPKPRVFRAVRQRAIINRLGFNNEGVDRCVARVRAARLHTDIPIGINIGKNLDTPVSRAADDYLTCLDAVHGDADYVTINVSSPNTPGLRDLQADEAITDLLSKVATRRQRLADGEGRRTPVLLKIAPDMPEDGIRTLGRLAVTHGMDGLIATNTTITRPGALPEDVAAEVGGLSGPPLAALATAALRALRTELGNDFPIIGVGGIDSARTARERREAGANLIQIYTGLIYRGPGLVRELTSAMSRSVLK